MLAYYQHDADTSCSETDSECEDKRKHLIFLEATRILSKRTIDLYMDNSKRIRSSLEFIHSWDDALFYRQFRVVRADFYELLSKITESIGSANLRMKESLAMRRYGVFVRLETKLCITLRLLAGASYLDMIWYGPSLSYTQKIFVYILNYCTCLLFKALSNFPQLMHSGPMLLLAGE